MDFPCSTVQKAYQLAREALKNSYCPYSNFKVSACLKVKGAELYVSGVNVENGSLGATICAERSALVSLISQFGYEKEIEFLLLCTQPSTVPCCLCRQVLSEFCCPQMPIYISSVKKGLEHCYTFGELAPHSFGPEEYKRIKATISP
ncbi:UNVERIFIED_CONTAM: hypothetical protein PYX00_011936 [Menopon gallinae]|uniref:Cytidine deaminase n=1 Tax=Menopon gallinae TaxID=328185 RepID=A0AAW2H961_9NEOP